MVTDTREILVSQRVIRAFAVLQIVSSAGALAITAWTVVKVMTKASVNIAAFIIPLGLFGLTLAAGLLVWHGRRSGLLWFLGSQLLQVPTFSVAGVKYGFLTGIGWLDSSAKCNT
jgi:hypothetical protein